MWQHQRESLRVIAKELKVDRPKVAYRSNNAKGSDHWSGKAGKGEKGKYMLGLEDK